MPYGLVRVLWGHGVKRRRKDGPPLLGDPRRCWRRRALFRGEGVGRPEPPAGTPGGRPYPGPEHHPEPLDGGLQEVLGAALQGASASVAGGRGSAKGAAMGWRYGRGLR